MNRKVSNIIRFIMDEFIPPFIRNSYWFMYPFYYVGTRGKNVKEIMNFKSNVQNFTEEQYIEFYNKLDSVSRRRRTDLTKSTIKFILKSIDINSTSLADIGCGNGFLLKKIKSEHPRLQLTGVDIAKKFEDDDISFINANIRQLPFEDKQFDIVVCTHTIEHILNLDEAIKELERITKKQLIIVTPCQRYFYYTLDEHVNFFPKKEMLTGLFSFENFIIKKIDFDWVYIGYNS